jgi:HNH endonuclease
MALFSISKDTLSYGGNTMTDVTERLEARATRLDNGCLVVNPSGDGYGSVRYKGSKRHPSRVMWIETFGDPGSDLVVRHTCDNPPCIEISHLQIGTHKDNIHDAIKRGRFVFRSGEQWERHEVCSKGHNNWYIEPGRGHRMCKTCNNDRNREAMRQRRLDPEFKAKEQAYGREYMRQKRALLKQGK